LVIDAGAWCDSAGYKDKLSLINSAIDDGKVISFTYHDRNGSKSVRFSEPHTILFKEGTWYVYAFCRLREEFRFFKVGRMTDIKCIEESFTRRELPSNLPFETWYEHSSLIDVKLKVGGQSLFAVEEWLGVENIHEENGVFYATASLPDEDSLVGKILSFGVGVKVIAPDTLKNKIKKAVKDIYNGN
jgi:predicted DNA-binding transcriptional regulator YafY